MILLTVIAAIMIMSILVLGILSRNVSRAMVSEDEFKRSQAALLAKGAAWRGYAAYAGGGAPVDFSYKVDGVTYTVNYTQTPGAGPDGTTGFTVNVGY